MLPAPTMLLSAVSLLLILTLFPANLSATAPVDATEEPAPGTCEEVTLITCFLPIVAFVLSDEVQQFTPQTAKGNLTREQFDKLCGLGKGLATCFKDYTDNCVPRNLTDVHVAAAGTIQFLAFCDDPSMFPKIQKVFKCAQSMEITHNRCAAQESQTVNAARSGIDTSNPVAALQRQYVLRDLCCLVRNYEQCYLNEVEEKCGADVKSYHQDLQNRIYSAYQCNQHPNCNA